MYDYHIHLYYSGRDTPREFLGKTAEAGVDGGAVISPYPAGHSRTAGADQRWQARLEDVLEFTSQTPGFLPVFWIDPTEPDVREQIFRAAEKGVRGFKIICVRCYPRDILTPLGAVAETGLPVTFHCGILFNTSPAAKYNRPLEFEVLCQVRGLRFSLAHTGWPWTDEYNAVFGEFRWGPNDVDAYADLTPGTPDIYRRDVLKKLYLCGIPRIRKRVLWGSDSNARNYGAGPVKQLIRMDEAILAEIASEASKYGVEESYDDLLPLLAKKNMESFFTRKEK
ncbi:MAG: amidohydrolase family protein [Lentisphaeria bacterium]|nr:amidohydrolase family protein [Lentisphaeria bacterium]